MNLTCLLSAIMTMASLLSGWSSCPFIISSHIRPSSVSSGDQCLGSFE